ncbi:hypothetical protein BDZ91DRAFT_722822 [Kalaharituber pfeilii]|nr:hypothetical protein BDZ91DRAFT_722822 [Kalaharituber pfeilii]
MDFTLGPSTRAKVQLKGLNPTKEDPLFQMPPLDSTSVIIKRERDAPESADTRVSKRPRGRGGRKSLNTKSRMQAMEKQYGIGAVQEAQALVLDDYQTNFKQPGVPSNVNAAVNIRRIQEAEGLDEEEMEEESEAIDLSNITEVPDPLPTLSLPEDTQFGSARERGEFLANLSTPGLLEYCNYRCDLEYEYLAEQMEILRDRCTKIEKIKEEIKAKAEARAREWSEVLGQILPGGSNRQKLSPAPSKLGTKFAGQGRGGWALRYFG